MLQGRHLSPVQAFASELALVIEQRAASFDFADRFKLAVVAADPGHYTRLMYPDWFTDEVKEVEDEEDEEGATLVFTEEVTPEDAERIVQELLAERGGSLTGEDLEKWS